MLDLGIIIPVYNEERNIEDVLKKLKKFNVYVVNDGSTDQTINILNKYKNQITLVNLKKNEGYERAVLKGFEKTKNKFKHIITLDGDGQHSTSQIEKTYKYFLDKNLDLLVGNRSNFNRIEEHILSFFFNLKFKIKDPLSGFKIYDSRKLNLILRKSKTDNTFLVGILVKYLKLNLKVGNYKIIAKKNKQSQIGNGISVKIKILNLLKFCF